MPCEWFQLGPGVLQYSSHRRPDSRATASGRYPRWAGGLPVGGTWKEHPSVQLGAPRLSCIPQAWAAPAPGSGLTPSLWVGKSSEDPHVQLLFWAPTGTSKLPHSPLSAAQQILEEVSFTNSAGNAG